MLAIAGTAFYWYEWRPAQIREHCRTTAEDSALPRIQERTPTLDPTVKELAAVKYILNEQCLHQYGFVGPDRDCNDFPVHSAARAFFEAAGGPTLDPHDLDRDRDGIACEDLK